MKTYTVEIWKFRDFEQLPEYLTIELEANNPKQLEIRLNRMKDLFILSGCQAVEYKLLN